MEISNPKSYKDIAERALTKEHYRVNNSSGTSIVCRRDAPQYGSYGVFLPIIVKRDYFDDEMVPGIAAFELSKEYAEAMLMGRFKNGTPLAISDKPQKDLEFEINGESVDFDYKHSSAKRCPYFAHTRSVNPRTNDRRNPPIIRRSMNWCDNLDDNASVKGMCFLSLQSSIAEDFIPIFKRFNEYSEDDRDALIYQPDNKWRSLKIMTGAGHAGVSWRGEENS